MPRAAAPPTGSLVPDPSPLSLRAPSRGRKAHHQHLPLRSYGHLHGGSHHAGPRTQPPQAMGRSLAPAPGHRPQAPAAAPSLPAGAATTTTTTTTATTNIAMSRPVPSSGPRGWHVVSAAMAPNSVSIGGVSAPALAQAPLRVGAGASATASRSAGGAIAVAKPRCRGGAAAAGRYTGPAAGFSGGAGLCTPAGSHPHPHPHTRPASRASPHLLSGYWAPGGPLALARWMQAARAQWAADARMRLHAVKSSGASASSSSGTLQAGALVEFEKNDRDVLGLVVGPDGKKNWFVVDQSGRRQSVAPKAVGLMLPGSGYTEADLGAFAAAAEGADMALLEIAWEIALDGGTPLDLPALAALLFDDTSPRSLYVTHRMLRRDSLFFKQAARSPSALAASFTARPADEVAALRRQQEAAEAVRLEAEAWRAAVAAARGAKSRSQLPSAAEWQSGQFAKRIAALKSVAVSLERTDAAGLQLALSSLQLAGSGSRADPEVAAGLLTELGVFRRHEPMELLRRGLTAAHSEERERQAQELLAAPPPDPDADLREDLSHLTVFTIDDASTREVDDGLSLERLPSGGGSRIWIHVADPTRWIRPGSSLDLAGRERIRTLYLPWGSVPMFPRALAEGPFSLREGQVCDAMSVGVVLRPDGSLGPCRVVPSRVRVSHKLTYDLADRVLGEAAAGGEAAAEGEEAAEGPVAAGLVDEEAAELLYELMQAAMRRRSYRESRGCIEIPLPEAKIHVPYDHLDRARPAVTINRISQWESVSRSVVAEMMILAGEAVGSLGSEADLPLPYRAQDSPDLPPATILDALPPGPCRGFALKRCMTRSTVSSAPQRHASLALDAYVQFTSPIRRYADLLAHYNLKAWLRGEPLPFSAAAIDAIADGAAEAGRELGGVERDSEAYWVAEYLRLHWGAEFPAMVLGWQREDLQLAAFLLEEQGLEVVVRLPNGSAFTPGDRCVLMAKEANPAAGHYRFYLAGWTSGRGAEGGEEEEKEEGEGEGVQVFGVDGEEEEEKEVGVEGSGKGEEEGTGKGLVGTVEA